jgi:hypothetical protein
VRKFFQLKREMQEKWAKHHRILVRILDSNASSRCEGEFSNLWELGLTSGMTFITSITKIRFGSDRRMRRKIVRAEGYMGNKLKRRSIPLYDASPDDWECMCDKFTSHYSKAIEKQIAAAHTYLTCQLVQKDRNDTTLKWKVWSKCFGEQDREDTDDESDAEDEDLHAQDDLAAPVSFQVNGEDTGDCPDFPSRASTNVDEDEDSHELQQFKWRYVRTVCARKVGKKYEFVCDCGYLERTCVVCRHIFIVFWHVFKEWRISKFKWHKRTTRNYYYSVIVTDKPLNTDLASRDCTQVATMQRWRQQLVELKQVGMVYLLLDY